MPPFRTGDPEVLPLVATLNGPPGLRLGARVERPVTRAIAARWREATEAPAGTYTVALDLPLPPEPQGQRPTPDPGYVVAWLTADAEPPAYEAVQPYVAPPAP